MLSLVSPQVLALFTHSQLEEICSVDGVAGCYASCVLLWRYGNVAAANELLDISISAGKTATVSPEDWRGMTALAYSLVAGVMLYVLGRDEEAVELMRHQKVTWYASKMSFLRVLLARTLMTCDTASFARPRTNAHARVEVWEETLPLVGNDPKTFFKPDDLTWFVILLAHEDGCHAVCSNLTCAFFTGNSELCTHWWPMMSLPKRLFRPFQMQTRWRDSASSRTQSSGPCTHVICVV